MPQEDFMDFQDSQILSIRTIRSKEHNNIQALIVNERENRTPELTAQFKEFAKQIADLAKDLD